MPIISGNAHPSGSHNFQPTENPENRSHPAQANTNPANANESGRIRIVEPAPPRAEERMSEVPTPKLVKKSSWSERLRNAVPGNAKEEAGSSEQDAGRRPSLGKKKSSWDLLRRKGSGDDVQGEGALRFDNPFASTGERPEKPSRKGSDREELDPKAPPPLRTKSSAGEMWQSFLNSGERMMRRKSSTPHLRQTYEASGPSLSRQSSMGNLLESPIKESPMEEEAPPMWRKSSTGDWLQTRFGSGSEALLRRKSSTNLAPEQGSESPDPRLRKKSSTGEMFQSFFRSGSMPVLNRKDSLGDLLQPPQEGLALRKKKSFTDRVRTFMEKAWATSKAHESVGPVNSNLVSTRTRDFVERPVAFLRSFSMFEHISLQTERSMEERLNNPELSANPLLNPGILDFRFAPSAISPQNAVLLSPLLREDESGNWNAVQDDLPAFPAYWLPWKPDAATEITLGDQADFFFTSQLGGCRVHVDNRDPLAPKVVHVAGVRDITNLPADSAWKDARAREVLGEDAYAASSQISFTKGDWPSQYKEGFNVIGLRDKEDGKWSFWVQQCDPMASKVTYMHRWKPEDSAIPVPIPADVEADVDTARNAIAPW